MKTWKLCLLSLVPGVLGWLCNLLLSWTLFASLPAFLSPICCSTSLTISPTPGRHRLLPVAGPSVRAGEIFVPPNICSAPSGQRAASLILYVWAVPLRL